MVATTATGEGIGTKGCIRRLVLDIGAAEYKATIKGLKRSLILFHCSCVSHT
ncbi:hypothetical protein [Porphyromonas levii]|uniref:hypothetical protein n=1 Tax=Porphyromonas levii TaxID=28114 RepID=UPI001BAA1C7D|nr:hypothetical protein [Porphyromonas levii]